MGEPKSDILGRLSNARYRTESYISRGAQGLVLLAKDTQDQKTVALKLIPCASTRTKYAEREILNQLKLSHPHIIRLEEVFVDSQHLVLVLEYADKGDLHAYVRQKRRLNESEARWIFQQLMLAVDFSHRVGIANRDIKLENILLASSKGRRDRPMVKLADWGLSSDERMQSAPTTRVGTLNYIAPEVLFNASDRVYDARKADVWSCGVVLYNMLTGRHPFPDNAAATVGKRNSIKNIMEGEFVPPEHAAAECISLLRSMLTPDPEERFGVEDVLAHAWYLQGLNPAVSSFNSKLLAKLQCSGIPEKTVQEVKAVVKAARSLGKIVEEPDTGSGAERLYLNAVVSYADDFVQGCRQITILKLLGDWVNDRGLLKALFESGAVSRCDTESAIHAAKVAKFSLESAKLE